MTTHPLPASVSVSAFTSALPPGPGDPLLHGLGARTGDERPARESAPYDRRRPISGPVRAARATGAALPGELLDRSAELTGLDEGTATFPEVSGTGERPHRARSRSCQRPAAPRRLVRRGGQRGLRFPKRRIR